MCTKPGNLTKKVSLMLKATKDKLQYVLIIQYSNLSVFGITVFVLLYVFMYFLPVLINFEYNYLLCIIQNQIII
jgi:hypothetical protein